MAYFLPHVALIVPAEFGILWIQLGVAFTLCPKPISLSQLHGLQLWVIRIKTLQDVVTNLFDEDFLLVLKHLTYVQEKVQIHTSSVLVCHMEL